VKQIRREEYREGIERVNDKELNKEDRKKEDT
jgi:hypothetical protein